MDVLTRRQRSYCMSRIRGSNTGPELALRRGLWSKGFRYRVKSGLPGKPDLVFARARIVVFLDGCFWHGCALHAQQPKTNSEFWLTKISKNKQRDIEVTNLLNFAGWTVLRYWEHEVREDIDKVSRAISRAIRRANATGRAKPRAGRRKQKSV
jgi:DNA mismatch endonuclease, patch repair protein